MHDLRENMYSLIQTIPSRFEDAAAFVSNFLDEHEATISAVGDIAKIASPAVKLFLSVYGYANRKKMEAFLITFAKKANSGVIVADEKYKEKLFAFMEKQKNAMFIANTIEACKHSQSIKVTALLGYYAGVHLEKLRDIDYIDLLVLDSLNSLNDDDIDLFVKIFDFLQGAEKQEEFDDTIFKNVGIEVKYTLDKLKRSQVISTSHTSVSFHAYGATGAPVYPRSGINEVTRRLYNLIKECL